MIADSRVDAGAQVGPFARLRMEAQVGADARIGNFVELKKTRLGAGAKSQHLAYLGDAQIGSGSTSAPAPSPATTTARRNIRPTSATGAFIGSNSTLVAPVEIGDDSYVGAGSVITEAVPPGAWRWAARGR